MKGRNFAGAVAVSGAALSAVVALAQTVPATTGPAANGSPAWYLQGSFPDPGGNTTVTPGGNVSVIPMVAAARSQVMTVCKDAIASLCAGQVGFGATGCLKTNVDKLSGQCKEAVAAIPAAPGDAVPGCTHSTICGHVGGAPRGQMQRVQWKQTLGYTYTYPYDLPQGTGGVPSVALDSKGDLWAFKRSPAGTPQLYEFGPDHKLIRTVGDNVIGHADKAHGMAVDAHDNVWICDAALATVKEISPEGKLLRTIGTSGHRGDWDEAKGQRLLWQPVMLAFGPKGDIYIGEGHANESPNDVGSPDPANVLGAARIIHLSADGKFINQWLGDEVGQGKFDSTHGLAVDPKTGDVWIGDREQYRIVVYSGDGRFLRTMQMRNLVCALQFDAEGNPWMASGQDGQFLKLTRDGKVIGAVGKGMGIGPGQFIEASYFVFDKHDDIYAGDTSVGRITEMVAPKG